MSENQDKLDRVEKKFDEERVNNDETPITVSNSIDAFVSGLLERQGLSNQRAW